MRRTLVSSLTYCVWAVSCFANGASDIESRKRTAAEKPADSVVICNTSACTGIARRLLDSIDDAIDPCDNFYQYACGKWPQNHPIPANKPGVSPFWELEDSIAQVIKGLLEQESTENLPLDRKLKRLFSQCMEIGKRDRLGATPLLTFLDYSLGGWPLLTPNWNHFKFNVSDTLLKSFLAGTEPFFAIEANDQKTNPQLHFITVKEPVTFASSDILKDQLLGKLYSESYQQFVFNITTLLLREKNSSAIERNILSAKIMDIFSIENNISLARAPINETNDEKYRQQFTLSELEASIPFNSSIMRNLTTLIRSYIAAAGVAMSLQEGANMTIVIKNLPLLAMLDNLFLEFEQQGVGGMERLANYLGWYIVQTHVDKLSKDYLDVLSRYTANIYGMPTKSETMLGMRCVKDIRRSMPLAVGATYVKNEVTHKAIQQATLLVKSVQAGFGQLLERAAFKWLDNATYERAVKKLSSMIIEVGYPRALLAHTSVLDEHYKDISVEDNYFESMLTVARSLKFRNLKRLAKPSRRDDPLNQDEWLSDVTMVQAHNDFNRNRIVVNAALLHPPFFNPDGPQFQNYGALGNIVGHEITHAFDGAASGFDDQGVWRNWWSETAKKELNERIEEMTQFQYGHCMTEFGKADGEMTSAENVADNGGQRAAYKAFLHHLEHSAVPEKIPAQLQHYSPQQLFFLSAALPLCNKYRPAYGKLDFLVNAHFPAECRINELVPNMEGFAQAFNCSADAKLNNEFKIIVW